MKGGLNTRLLFFTPFISLSAPGNWCVYSVITLTKMFKIACILSGMSTFHDREILLRKTLILSELDLP